MTRLASVLIGAIAITASVCAGATQLAPLPTPFTRLVQLSDPGHFDFAVAGDNRSAGHGEPMPPSFAEICTEMGLIGPSLTFWTGDAIEGYDDTPAEASQEYDVFLSGLALTGVPSFNAPGNHEFSTDRSLVAVYKKRMGELYGSFDYGNSHFVQLNSCSVLPDGSIRDASIDETQWAWLDQDLKDHVGAGNIFLFLHHYPFGRPIDDPALNTGFANVADRDRLHALCVKYGVRAVFAGHAHMFISTVKDGVQYIVTGGGGAPLDALPQDGGYLHYLLVHVTGTKISFDVLQPWHLLVYRPDPAPGVVAEAHVSNTQGIEVFIHGLKFRVPVADRGKKYTISAHVSYKGKTKPATASILSVEPVAQNSGLVDVTVAGSLVKSRATIFDLLQVDDTQASR